MNLNYRFISNFQRALTRRQPISYEYAPSMRLEDAMVPSDDPRGFRDLLFVIDNHMSPQAAQYLFENTSRATKKGQVGLNNTKFVIVPWDEGGLGEYGACRGSRRLLQVMTEMYSQCTGAGSLDTLFQQLYKKFLKVEQIIILTDGRFKKHEESALTYSQISKKSIVIIVDSFINSSGNLNTDYDIPQSIPVIGLESQDVVASQN